MTESIGFFLGFTEVPQPWPASQMLDTWKPGGEHGGTVDLTPLDWHAAKYKTTLDGVNEVELGISYANLVAVSTERYGSTKACAYWLIGGLDGQEHKRLTDTCDTELRTTAQHPYRWDPPGCYHRYVPFGNNYLEPAPTTANGDWWMTKEYASSGRVVLCHSTTGRLYDMKKILGPEDFPGNKPVDYLKNVKIQCAPVNPTLLLDIDGYLWTVQTDGVGGPHKLEHIGRGTANPVDIHGWTPNGYIHAVLNDYSQYWVGFDEEPAPPSGSIVGIYLDFGSETGLDGHGPLYINGGAPESLPSPSPDHQTYVYLVQGADVGDKAAYWHGYSTDPTDGGLIFDQSISPDWVLRGGMDLGQKVWNHHSWPQWLFFNADPVSSIAEIDSTNRGSWVYTGSASKPIIHPVEPYRPFEAT